MLAVSPLRDTRNDEKQGEVESGFEGMGFPELGDASLLDSIDFDDLFIGIGDGDVLPDLEMDSEILAEFSDDYSDLNAAISSEEKPSDADDKLSASDSSGETESLSRREERARANDGDKRGRKTSTASQSKNCQGKRKVKVDWTPDLHRRFVQAVEQLGMDKAVPSRILEIMGIDCLTRHNIASHLQKYRSHRKHLLAREAEAASWSQRRQVYGKSPPWPPAPPTMGFPPMPATPQPPPHHLRPLHVWGHPTIDRNLMHAWPPNPPQAASYWHSHHQRVPNVLTPGMPFFPQPLPAPQRLMAGILRPVASQAHEPPPASDLRHRPGPHPFFDFVPTKESIDAAIGDVISKPWLPLPLGLKPPSTDSVMTELQRQGVPKVPFSCA